MSQASVIAFDAEARATARAAGLCYVSDARAGIRRLRKRRKFSFVDERGRAITRETELARIRALAIPPAWTEVWICPLAHGHIQATGRDARGRKQYRYHAKWSRARDAAKHARMCEFAARLPSVRAHCQQLLGTRGLTREKVLAALVRTVDLTGIRVGHEEYARHNDSFGLTTLRVRHVSVRGARVELRFKGKSKVQRHLQLHDRALAKVFARCRALGGPQLFKFHDQQGRLRRVSADHVNAFLRQLMGPNFSIKDFRTWTATVRVAVELSRYQPANSRRATSSQLMAAVRKAAEHLGNTPAICRKSYIHPLIVDAHASGRVLSGLQRRLEDAPDYCAHEDSVRRFLLALMREETSERRKVS